MSSTESETERQNDFKKFGSELYSLESIKIKVPVACDRNSVNDLASSYVINDVDGRIGYKTSCKYECYTPIETTIELVCCLEITKTCKPRFYGTSCLYGFRSDRHFVL